MYKLQSMKGKVAKTAVATVMTVALATMGLVGVAFAADPADNQLKKGTDVLLKRTEIVDPDISVTVPVAITAALYAHPSDNFYEILYADSAYIENFSDNDAEVEVAKVDVDATYGFGIVAKSTLVQDSDTLWTTLGGIGGAKLIDLGKSADLTAPEGWEMGAMGSDTAKLYLNFEGQAAAKETSLTETPEKAYEIIWTFQKKA